MSQSPIDVPRLELEATIGFNGSVPCGLKVHPDRQHAIYALGCTVIIEDITSNKRSQEFLSGHTNDVSCIAVSKNGRYIASGQATYMGFKAEIIVWDWETRSVHCKLVLHKVKVESLAFSPNDTFLVSLGGQDDGCVVVWNVEKKEAICGSPAQVESAGTTNCIAYANNSDYLFVTGGNHTLRVWELDVQNRKIRPTDVNMGQVKRIIKCMEVSEDDKFFYCGTTTGDIIAINMDTRLFQHVGPEKNRFSLGVTSLTQLQTGEFLVGSGDGTVAITYGLDKKFKRKDKVQKLDGAVTSLALRGKGHQFYCGTAKAHIYRFNLAEFTHELVNTCHYSAINDIAFPYACPELFATCSHQDIRIWHTSESKELLRITVPNMTCNSIDFMKDGKSIISGWDDGKIRAFYPETGKSMYEIKDAHNQGVSAIACLDNRQFGDERIISGGGEGQVRVWRVGKSMPLSGKGVMYTSELLGQMKEHKGTVTCIKVKRNNQECISSSTDGTCIIWNLERFVRNQIIFANTLFKCVCYHPQEVQMITSGSDRKIGYWEILDGSQIRELEGSKAGAVNGMDMTEDGKYYVTGGDDKLIKVWTYDEGEVTDVGLGHSGNILRLRISPDCRHIISVSADGAIIRWKFPHNV